MNKERDHKAILALRERNIPIIEDEGADRGQRQYCDEQLAWFERRFMETYGEEP